MSEYYRIEKALISVFDQIKGSMPAGYPGAELDADQLPDDLWAQVNNVRVASDVVTLGDSGEDNHTGFFQIDLNYPKGRGTKAVLEKADEIASSVPAGTLIDFGGQKVKILSTELSPGRYVGGYYRVSLTINYYARTIRRA